MASEVDPLILEIRADLANYRAQLKSTTSLVTSSLDRQNKSVVNLERQMQRSSGAISGSLKGIAASLAGAFSVQQIGALVDNFTRLQNSLRVSGLEGEGLANVQAKLLDLSGRYGTSINDLADLYGKSSQAAAELGASESQLLQVTEASAQALKITGTSAAQAQGALLGLTQALSSGVVRAEEFNQINEGGLRPLLQAAANTEAYGGSVAKLRAAVVDGKLSSQEFYQAILSGSAELDAKASKATLTLAGAFTALASQLTVYIGEASAANGVTAGLAEGIGALADNLDVIIPALAVIAVAIGGRLAASALVGGNSLRALAAYASIATTSLAGTALAARGAGAALLAAFGGPVGLAITGIALGLAYVATESASASRELDDLKASASAAEDEADKMEARLRSAGVALENTRDSAKNAADGIDATSRAAAQAQKRLKGLEDQAGITALKLNLLKLEELQGEKRALQSRSDNGSVRTFLLGGEAGFGNARGALQDQDNERLSSIDREIAARQRTRNALITGIKSGVNVTQEPSSPKVTSSTSKSKKGGASRNAPKDRKRASGPSAEELRFRAESEQRQLDLEVLRAKSALTENIEDKVEFEKQSLEIEKAQRIADLAANKDLSAAQRAAKQEVIDELFGTSRELDAQGNIIAEGRPSLLAQQLNREIQLKQDQESADLALQIKNGLVDELNHVADNARTLEDRRDALKAIAQLEFNYKVGQIEQALLQKDISEVKREELLAARANAAAEVARQQSGADRDAQGPLSAYLDELENSSENISRNVEGIAVNALNDLSAGLANAIVEGESLGDVLENTGKRFLKQLLEIAIQLLIIKPLLAALGGGSSGGASFLGIPGFANGTKYAPGGRALVGERGPEIVNLPRGSQVIPNSLINQQAKGGGGASGVSVIRLELSGDIQAQMTEIASGVSVEVVRTVAPAIRDSAVKETFKQSQRPRLGR